MEDGSGNVGPPLEDLDVLALAYASRTALAGEEMRRRLRDELTVRCLPFANRLARRYRDRGELFEDLEQVARLGLVKAIDRYDPERGSFTAYAVITISGEIKRHFRDVSWNVPVPRRMRDLSLEVGRATATLTAPVGGDDGGALVDLSGGTDDGLESVDDRLTVSRLLPSLPDRVRRMLALRFYGNLSQAEIAAELGISQMHVSRLLSRALSWLREAILSDVPPYWEGGDTGVDPHLMRVTITRTEGAVTVRVHGEVDRDVAERVRRRLRVAISTTAGTGDRLVVDLSGVPLIDAAGTGVLIDAASTAAGADLPFTLIGARRHVAHILTVSGRSPASFR